MDHGRSHYESSIMNYEWSEYQDFRFQFDTELLFDCMLYVSNHLANVVGCGRTEIDNVVGVFGAELRATHCVASQSGA